MSMPSYAGGADDCILFMNFFQKLISLTSLCQKAKCPPEKCGKEGEKQFATRHDFEEFPLFGNSRNPQSHERTGGSWRGGVLGPGWVRGRATAGSRRTRHTRFPREITRVRVETTPRASPETPPRQDISAEQEDTTSKANLTA